MTLPVLATIDDVRAAVAQARGLGRRIGFVPTMGALHAGHARLIEAAHSECDFVVVSIFVNPTQFGPAEDFGRYPRTLEADRDLSFQAGAHIIFAPSVSEMYPEGFRTFVEVHDLQDVLCGASRPGHFRGVCTVVLKLFHIVRPDVAFFGQKDAQQALILKKMVRDLDVPIVMRIVPTVREADGLAMSSRNRYLSPAERSQAPRLYAALQSAQRQIERGERRAEVIETDLNAALASVPGGRVDYARVVSAETLRAPHRLMGPVLIAAALFLGTTRLIDNISIDVSDL